MTAQPPRLEPESPTAHPARRVAKYLVGLLVAFGVLGAVGSRVVDKVFSSAEETLRPETPVLVGVRDELDGSDGFAVAMRSPAAMEKEVVGVKSCNALLAAAMQAGAVDLEVVSKQLILEGGTKRDVSIVAMHANVLRREPSLDGARVSCQSAGAVDAIGVVFDLDEARPVARRIKNTGSPVPEPDGPYFTHGKILRLVKGEIQPFEIYGVISEGYVEWKIEADMIIDGKAQTITIDDHGKPFIVSAHSGREGYRRYYEWQWYVQPPRMWIADRPPTP